MSATLSDKARAFLNEQRYAVLATIHKDGSTQQTVMWYLLEGDAIIMNTKKGRIKDRNIRRDSRISICIQEGYNYVTISGIAELDDDPEIGQRDIYRLAVRYNGEATAQRQMAGEFSKEQRETIRLPITHVIEDLE
ncbi:MAG TPA: PPOX class F420-dependent oxidoreductase [Ktedonobacteraceae bacterium]|nr:PPOX class F420-dependent oxidoreductase [Ktedonobacteraceae bacterium]